MAGAVDMLAGRVDRMEQTVNGFRSCNCNLSGVQQLTDRMQNLLENCREITARNRDIIIRQQQVQEEFK